jgi:geranylgeranyl pyrophosphate synthase
MRFDDLIGRHLDTLQAQLAAWQDPHQPLGLPQAFALRPQARPAGSALLQQMAWAQLASGGKRLRGVLPIALVAACGGETAAAAVLGAAIELVHNGTLAHDDVQDGDRLRRGQPTLWTVHGVAQAINAGDALLTAPIAQLLRAPQLSPQHRGLLAGLLAEAVVETVRGQVADIALRDLDPVTLDDLLAFHLASTGPLFGACLEGAVCLLGGEADARRQAREAAHALGLAFQIRDDVLDLVGTKGRGAAGADLREGKLTAPLLLAIEADPAQAAALRVDLARAAAGEALDAATVAHWVSWAVQTGGQARAEAMLADAIGTYERQACAAVAAWDRQGHAAVLVKALGARLRQLDG